MSNFTPQQVHHVAQLANIPVTPSEEKKLAADFSETLNVIENLQSVDVSRVTPTYQVTGLENVLRADQVDESQMFSQSEALANAQDTHQGYFVVPQVISK